MYPVRDRNVVISEHYLNSLQAQVDAGTHALISSNRPNPLQGPHRPFAASGSVSDFRSTAVPVLRNATAEAFVSGLKKLGGPDPTRPPTVGAPVNNFGTVSGSDDQDEGSQYDYVPLDFDTLCKDPTSLL